MSEAPEHDALEPPLQPGVVADAPPDASAGSPSASDARTFFVRIFPSIMLPMFIAVVDQTIVATALPAIATSLGDADRVSWIVISYLIANTVAAPIYGRLGDAFGRRRILFVALGVMIVASIACALSTSLLMLAAFRVVQGLGGGGLMTSSQALIGETIAPRERARYQGYLAAVVVVSNSFGPVAGGWLTEAFGWRSVFWLNLPLGLIAVALTFRLPAKAPGNTPWRFDVGGLVFFILFIVPALLVLEQVRTISLANAPLIVAMALLSVLSGWLLIRQERREELPLLPLAVWRQSTIWRSDALAACHGATLVSLITFAPIYLHVVRGVTPAQMGYALVPVALGIGVGSLVTGRLVSTTGRTMIFPSLAMIPTIALFLLLAAVLDRITVTQFGILLGFMALFMGAVMGVVQITVQNAAPRGMLGSAAGSVQFSRAVGATFGTALVSVILFATLGHLAPEALEGFGALMATGGEAFASSTNGPEVQAALITSFRVVFLTLALFATGALGFAWSIPARRL